MSLILVSSELARWWRGEEMHTFAVEKGVGRDMQLNLDIVVKMQCSDLHVNVQDAAGDRILAAQMLTRDPTNWAHWVDNAGMHRLGKDKDGKVITGEGWASTEHDEGFGEEHIHDIVALGKRRAKWGKTPRLWGAQGDSCRIFGSLELNKVQGDFHITARGHGYMGEGEHLDHGGKFLGIRAGIRARPKYPMLTISNQPSTSRISSQSCHLVRSSLRSSTPSIRRSTPPRRISTSSSITCPLSRRSTAWASRIWSGPPPCSPTSTR